MQTISKKLIFHSKALDQLLNALNIEGSSPRLVGGWVRDQMLGIASNDIDIATPLKPEEVIKALTAHRIKIIPTGLNFGTVTAILNDEYFEITSLRKDINCDGRHAIVEYTKDFALDAERRDFTINALSYCPFNHIIYDYHEGLEDLTNKKVRFIGDANIRIKEDYLRILRFFRFSSDYATALDKEGYKACKANKEGIKKLSKERIYIESSKIVLSNQSIQMLKAITKAEIEPFNGLQLKLDYEELPKSLSAAYALIFLGNNPTDLGYQLHDLGFASKVTKTIISLINFLSDFSQLRLTEFWVDDKNMEPYLDCAYYAKKIDTIELKELKNKFTLPPPKMPIDGNDLLDLGLQNQQIGICLQKLKLTWIESDFTFTKEQLLTMVKIDE